jgi:hypothetical protein
MAVSVLLRELELELELELEHFCFRGLWEDEMFALRCAHSHGAHFLFRVVVTNCVDLCGH